MSFEALKKYMEEQGKLDEAGEVIEEAKAEPKEVVKEAPPKDDDDKTQEEIDSEWYEVLLGTHFG
ncbi:MAG: hypothetical protein IJP24_06170 [Firmicutes bacterium]|nr:hypothetical protein [Bacillota bacterium]MBQ9973096.1 hypothetical protein [Bacillota bacterium]